MDSFEKWFELNLAEKALLILFDKRKELLARVEIVLRCDNRGRNPGGSGSNHT